MFKAFTQSGHCDAQPAATPVAAGQLPHTPCTLVALFSCATAAEQVAGLAGGTGGGGEGGGEGGKGGGGLYWYTLYVSLQKKGLAAPQPVRSVLLMHGVAALQLLELDVSQAFKDAKHMTPSLRTAAPTWYEVGHTQLNAPVETAKPPTQNAVSFVQRSPEALHPALASASHTFWLA